MNQNLQDQISSSKNISEFQKLCQIKTRRIRILIFNNASEFNFTKFIKFCNQGGIGRELTQAYSL